MMRKFMSIAAVFLLSGCLSPAPKAPVAWNIEADTALSVSVVSVCAPYDGTRFAVLRPDGSVAFDSFNVFAARPASLIRSAVSIDPAGPELVVRRIALDCRVPGERKAVVELRIRNAERTFASASAVCDAASGDFSQAFSAAFVEAARKAAAAIAEGNR